MPSGDASTRGRVVRSILENGPSSASTLAERLKLTAAAVRRHLDHLVAEGVVQGQEQRVYGTRGRGRPARVFALTETGRDQFDQQYDDLAAQALRFLVETGGEQSLVEFARQRVAFVERDYATVVAAEPELSPAEALARVFSAQGYEASVRALPTVGVADQLCQQHCPVAHVAHEFPQLCEAETEAIGRVLGTHVQRLATIAHGDGVCTTCIPAVHLQTAHPQTAQPQTGHPQTPHTRSIHSSKEG